MAERGEASSIPIDVMEMVDEFIWTLEDTAAFVGGRVVAAIRRYIEVDAAAAGRGAHEVQPGVRVLLAHARPHRAAPRSSSRRSGGSSSTTSARTCCAPTCRSASARSARCSITPGPIGEHEKYAARVFGAHRTYCVTNGTSMSNRVIFMAAVGRDQIALCDRNCHKSIEHSLVMTGGIPTYFVPLRNRYGIIGPIPPERLKAAPSRPRSRRTRWCRRASTRGRSTRSSPTRPTTGSATTPGACEELLDPSVDRIHFDEAWYAYARFNPIYRDRHAMHGDPKDHKGPTVFATHSTHKLLAALSQASLLHIRDGRSPIPHARFNESFMMQASTSPLYPIIVSNDVTAAMMDGPGGLALTNESIEEAVAFRQTMGRVHRSSRRRAIGSSTPGTRTPSRSGRTGKKVALRGCVSRAPRHAIPTAGCCTRARPGTASATSKTTTACSTRSRCRS